jgi:hypothetical protein
MKQQSGQHSCLQNGYKEYRSVAVLIAAEPRNSLNRKAVGDVLCILNQQEK